MEFKAFVYLVAFFTVSTIISLVHASEVGFTVDLIHHDSPKSPFYNPDETHYDRLTAAIYRSIARSNAISSPHHEVQSPIIPGAGDYLMRLSLGTPPFEIIAAADTGSDLIWTQCKPCDQCYKQEKPIFDPKGSKTYKEVACKADICSAIEGSCQGNGCNYTISYGDASFSNGSLATETFTLGSTDKRPVVIPNTVFGCGHENVGNSFNKRESGIVGLGPQSPSLISQLNTQIDGKFSYCLAPLFSNITSKLNFGSNAIVSGEGVVSTPLDVNLRFPFYYLSLDGTSVGDKSTNTVEVMIIDSGTTLTLLPAGTYDEFETSIKEAIKLEPVESPNPDLKLCYNVSRLEDIKVPPVTFHFYQADVELAVSNTFVAIKGVVCLAIIRTTEPIGIYGNIAQTNFHVGYDINVGTLSFQPTNCSNPTF